MRRERGEVRHRNRHRVATVLSLCVAGCSPSGGAEARESPSSTTDAGSGRTRPFPADAGGASDAGAAPCRPGTFDVCLEPPEEGFLLRSPGRTLEPGDDTEWCEVLSVPGDPGGVLHVNAIRGVMSQYVHHLHVRLIQPGSEADARSRPGERGLCSENGLVPYGTGLRLLYSQDLFKDSLAYPEGSALPVDAGAKLLVDYHFLNTSADPVLASAVLSFETLAPGEVRREVRRFGMHRTGFQVPAGSEAAFVTACSLTEDVLLLDLTRHTHRLGTDFTASVEVPERAARTLIPESDWSEHVMFPARPPIAAAKGTVLRFRCAFQNPSTTTVSSGTEPGDETCSLYGDYTSTRDGEAPAPEDCAVSDGEEETPVTGSSCTDCPPAE